MITALDISTSALVAQRSRMDAIAGNLANMSTTRDENGDIQPYQARFTVFQTDEELQTAQGAVGVKVARWKRRQWSPTTSINRIIRTRSRRENGKAMWPIRTST